MLYYKITKKYSHCQYKNQMLISDGFLVLEFVYTFFIITSFMVVIAYFSALCIHWQAQAKNQLKASLYAQNYLERILLDKTVRVPGIRKTEEGSYAVTVITEKHALPAGLPRRAAEIPLYSIKLIVAWINDKGHEQTVHIQSFC